MKKITHEEFERRLRWRLAKMSSAQLAHMLIKHAWDHVSEEFNNEILTEWEEDQIVTDAYVADVEVRCPFCENLTQIGYVAITSDEPTKVACQWKDCGKTFTLAARLTVHFVTE
jgi:hypothetical protein